MRVGRHKRQREHQKLPHNIPFCKIPRNARRAHHLLPNLLPSAGITDSKAIALNEYYADKYGTEKEWDSLTGFLKASNISASDFGEVLAALSESSEEDELAQDHFFQMVSVTHMR